MTARRLRRLALKGMIAGLTVAAIAAIVALVQGSIDDTEWRVIGTSFALSTFGSLAAVSASTRESPSALVRVLGTTASVLAVAAFAIFLPVVWLDGAGVVLAQVFGCVAVAAVATAHGALVIGAQRDSDTSAGLFLGYVSVWLAGADSLAAMGAIIGVVSSDGAAVFGAGLVLLVLTTALPPLLRRLQPDARPRPERPVASIHPPSVARELAAIADRLDAVEGAASEVTRLRRLARSLDAGRTP